MLLAPAAVTLIATAQPAGAASCQFTSVIGVNFGTYSVFNTSPTASTGSVTYKCNNGANSVTIDLSRGSAATYFPRQMLKSTEALQYNLYLDAAATQVWGDGTGGTVQYGPVNPPGNTNVTVTIFGRVPPGQDVSAGSYVDTITATINF